MNSGTPSSTGLCNLLKFMFNSNSKPKHPINIQKITDKTNLHNKKVNYFPLAFDYCMVFNAKKSRKSEKHPTL